MKKRMSRYAKSDHFNELKTKTNFKDRRMERTN